MGTHFILQKTPSRTCLIEGTFAVNHFTKVSNWIKKKGAQAKVGVTGRVLHLQVPI